MDAIYIFLLIGLASWGAHVGECPGCRRVFIGGIRFFMEGAVLTLGWPYELVRHALYAGAIRDAKASGELKTFKTGDYVIAIEKRKDESVEDFIARAKIEARAELEKRKGRTP